jgi:hypothetical protein
MIVEVPRVTRLAERMHGIDPRVWMDDLKDTEVGAAKIQSEEASGLAPSRRRGEVRWDHQEA